VLATIGVLPRKKNGNKSDRLLVRKVPFAPPICPVLHNPQTIFLGTKLVVLFPTVPLAIATQCVHIGQVHTRAPPQPSVAVINVRAKISNFHHIEE
jgi:hypothetical protein